MSVSEWKEYTVKELVDLKMLDKPLDGNHGGMHPKSSDYVTSGIPFIMANDLKDGKVDYKCCNFITEKQAKTLKKGFAKPGDVLLTHKATMGRTAIVDESYPYIVLTPQVTYYRVLKGIDNKYLKYYFDSKDFQELLLNWGGSGSTRAYLGITEQLKLPIILPPLPEQKAIAATLSALDDMIDLNNQINKTLEEMAQAIFKSWFVDFEPFRDGEFEESELGLIPKGWRIGILRDICNINMGQSPPSDTYNDIGIGMVFFQGIKDFGFKYPEETVYCSKPNKIAEPGDVLLSVRAPVGEINIAYKECCIGRGISSLKLKNHKNNILYYWLKTIKNQFHDVSNGSIFDAINKSGIESIKVVVPTEEIIDMFNNLIEPIDEEIFNNYQTTKALKIIRDILLPKLMNGEIRVPVEEVV